MTPRYQVELRPEAIRDLEEIPRNLLQRIVRAPESRLAIAPGNYGVTIQAIAGLTLIPSLLPVGEKGKSPSPVPGEGQG